MRKKEVRKAQVTVFIIIAIVLLLASAIALYFYMKVRSAVLKPEIIENIPEPARPVAVFIDTCIEKTSIDGLTLLGQHGGYLDLKANNIEVDRANPTESDGIDFAGGVSYWYYMDSPNNCRQCNFATKQPFLLKSSGEPSIQAQLESYVTSNLKDCLGDFKSFKEQGYTFLEQSDITTQAIITEENIFMDVTYKLKVTKDGTDYSLKRYTRIIPVNIKKIYTLADSIKKSEEQNKFLEASDVETVVTFTGINKDRMPPVVGTSIKLGGFVFWVKKDVEDNLKNIFSGYTNNVKVENSHYEIPADLSEYGKRIYGRVVPIEPGSYQDFDASFYYLDWPIYFDIDCNGQLCRPDIISLPPLNLLGIGIQDYSFVYDWSKPVLVAVHDANALNKRGYTFYFAMESNVRGNQPLQGVDTTLNVLNVGSDSMMCQVEQRNSGNITLRLLDASTGKPVPDVFVEFGTSARGCPIESTDANGMLVTKLPLVMNGILKFSKEPDYFPTRMFYTTKLEKEDKQTVSIQLYKHMNAVVKKKEVSKVGNDWVFTSSPKDLLFKEQAIVTITKVKETNEEEDFTQMIEFNGYDEPFDVKLVPGTYTVKTDLLLYPSPDKLVIPEDEICYRVCPVVCPKKCVKIPEVAFEDVFPEGGTTVENWVVGSDVMQKDTLEIYALSFNLQGVPEALRKHNDLEQMDKIANYAAIYRTSLLPVIK